jgi:SAM-dependent methyltransferase
MTPAQTFNAEQEARWNGYDGEIWVRQQARLDRMLAPVNGPLLEFAHPSPGNAILDIGCGCGDTTVAFAKAVGPTGRVIGADISEPMLGVAKERLREFPNVTCRLGDAGTLPLSDIAADLIVSRFGVMFFGDPTTAFTNLRTALAPRGRLAFACWRAISENPWMHVPLNAAYEHVPRLPKPDPDAPGPFTFADTERVAKILTAAGFTTPTFARLDIPMHLGDTLDAAVAQTCELGPAKGAMKDQPEDLVKAAVESIRRALATYATPAGVSLPGAVWLVSAES